LGPALGNKGQDAPALLGAKGPGPEKCYQMAEELLEEGNLRGAAMMFTKAKRYEDAPERADALWAECLAAKPSLYLYDYACFAIREDGRVYSYHVEYPEGLPGVDSWTDIVQISWCASENHAVGLRRDGTVVVSCLDPRACDGKACDTSHFKDIVDIDVAFNTIFGLKRDGTIVYTEISEYDAEELEPWTDVIEIEARRGPEIMALKADGSVLLNDEDDEVITAFRDVRMIDMDPGPALMDRDGVYHSWLGGHYRTYSAFEAEEYLYGEIWGSYGVIGLAADGTVTWGQEFATWDNQTIPDQLATWTDIVELAANDTVAGLRSDGTVVVTKNGYFDEILPTWTGIRVPKG